MSISNVDCGSSLFKNFLKWNNRESGRLGNIDVSKLNLTYLQAPSADLMKPATCFIFEVDTFYNLSLSGMNLFEGVNIILL